MATATIDLKTIIDNFPDPDEEYAGVMHYSEEALFCYLPEMAYNSFVNWMIGQGVGVKYPDHSTLAKRPANSAREPGRIIYFTQDVERYFREVAQP